MMNDDAVRCSKCANGMSHISDWLAVPLKELAFAASWGSETDNGWYWCAECNDWLHLPTANLMREIPF